MKKDLIFLGSEGITSTSANHVANMAKEYILSLEEFVANMSFKDTTIELLATNAVRPYLTGSTQSDINTLEEVIYQIASAKTLIAWLREGIKAKESLLEEINNLNVIDWCKQEGKEWPATPSSTNYEVEDELAKLTLEERYTYIRNQTMASTFGKLIHPAGHIAAARKDLQDCIKNPVELKGEGSNTIIYTSSPSVPFDEVDKVFFKLQTIQRNYQATFNSLEYNLKAKVEAEKAKRSNEHMTQFNKCRLDREQLNAEFSQYHQSETKRISDLKIVVPESLMPIYKDINSLGKNK